MTIHLSHPLLPFFDILTTTGGGLHAMKLGAVPHVGLKALPDYTQGCWGSTMFYT